MLSENAKKIISVLDKKKASDIVAIGISEVSILADTFVIASGTSSTHIRSLADDVEYELSQAGIEPNSVEGRASGWILLDYGDVIVHIFTEEQREYYGLERLWADAAKLDISEYVTK